MRINDFTGLLWNNIHTSDLGLVVVSDGSRYDANTLSDIENYTNEIPGNDGEYYFDSTLKSKTITIHFAFDNINELQRRKIRNWIATKDLHDLVFDECPYKAYSAKIVGKPEFTFICFDESKQRHSNDTEQNELNKRIYKGEGTLQFYIPVPYAHTTRDYTGKYMKYLEEIKYYTNFSKEFIANPKYLYSQEFGIADSIEINDIRFIQLLNFYGKTINTNNQFGRIGFSKEKPFKIKISEKEQCSMYIEPQEEDKNISNEITYLDYISGNYYDYISFVSDKDEPMKGQYKLFKSTNSIEVTFTNLKEEQDEFSGLYRYTFDLHQFLGNDKWKLLPSVPLNSKEKIKIDMIIEGFSQVFDKNEKYDHSFFISPEYGIDYEKKVKRPIFITLYTKEKMITKEEKEKKLTVIFPLDKPKELILKTNIKSIITYRADHSVNLSIEKITESSDKLIIPLRIDYRSLPVLYNNLREWATSSGLIASKKIIEDGIQKEYDRCYYQTLKDNIEYLQYIVGNKGDIDTPFKIRFQLNIPETFSFNDQEIGIFLQTNKNFEYIAQETIVTSILELEKKVLYTIKEKENNSNIFKGYIINIDFVNNIIYIQTEEKTVKKINFNKYIFSFSTNQQEQQALEYMILKFDKNIDSEIQALFKSNTQSNEIKYLEIDTNKQSINLIIQVKNTLIEKIVPMYCLFNRGTMFKLPKNFDKMYLFVYNNNKDKIFANTNKNTEIDYKYLYY